MGIKKTKLMACESMYWTDINDDIEKQIKNCCTCLDFQQTWPKEKIWHHKISAKPWEIVGVEMLIIHNRNYLCIVDYYGKFPVIKKMRDLSADRLILTCKIIFFRIWFTKKMMSDSGGNLFQLLSRHICRGLNIEQALSSPYHHQSGRQVEACIKHKKPILRKCFDAKSDPHIALLQISQPH